METPIYNPTTSAFIQAIIKKTSIDKEVIIVLDNPLNIVPGQYVKATFNNNTFYFSVFDYDEDSLILKLLVRNKENSSEKLNELLSSTGQDIEIEGWLGKDFLNGEYSNNLFISMGSWIAPMQSLLSVSKANKGIDNLFLHSEKFYKDIANLESFFTNFAEESKFFVTQEDTLKRRKDSFDRITSYLENLEETDEEFVKIQKINKVFICGSKEFVTSIRQTLENKFSINKEQIAS